MVTSPNLAENRPPNYALQPTRTAAPAWWVLKCRVRFERLSAKPLDGGMHTRTEADAEDDADRKVISDIHQYGWHVVAIPPEADTPGWAFSIGVFKTLGWPEIIVFGLDQEVAHWLINEVGRRAKEERATYAPGDQVSGLLEGVSCRFERVLGKWYVPFLGTALWYYFGPNFPVLQCIWPDHDGNYPWEEGFRKSWHWAQPLLSQESVEEARAAALLATME